MTELQVSRGYTYTALQVEEDVGDGHAAEHAAGQLLEDGAERLLRWPLDLFEEELPVVVEEFVHLVTCPGTTKTNS